MGVAAPTPAPAANRFLPGSIVAGRYRLVGLLGRGGMGEVYRADDLTLDQPVALKFLPEGVAANNTRLAQFHNELRVARTVSHKNVCRLYDLGDTDGRRFLTMEYVDGEDLSSALRRFGRMPPDKAIQIARQLCAGVSAAHERGVLHRDLKPANVMLDGNGDVRITDFGIAIAAADAGAEIAGTPQYMAPELLAGKAASTQERYLRTWLDPVRDLHRKACLRREDARRFEAIARDGDGDDALVDRARPRPCSRAGHPSLSRERSGTPSGVGADRRGIAAGRRPAGGRDRRRRNAVAGTTRRSRREPGDAGGSGTRDGGRLSRRDADIGRRGEPGRRSRAWCRWRFRAMRWPIARSRS